MNLQLMLPVISQAIGRDVTPEVQMFFRTRSAIGNALDPEGQKYFMENWMKVADFMETPEGKEAIQAFMIAWGKTISPFANTGKNVEQSVVPNPVVPT